MVVDPPAWANALYISQISGANEVLSPAKRYSKRITHAFESTQSELVTLRKRVAEQDELLRTRKVRKTGKRVALSGRFVLSTEDVLQIAKEAEREAADKKGKKKTTPAEAYVQNLKMERNIFDYVHIDSECDSDVVAEDIDEWRWVGRNLVSYFCVRPTFPGFTLV